MTDTTSPRAAPDLVPIAYTELRRLASAKLAAERPDHTLNATALVHEAYLRLGAEQSFESRSAFFRAAAEAMRRILVDHARARQAQKRGGERRRVELDDAASPTRPEELLALDEALTELEGHDATAAELVKLRFFSGLGHGEAAETLGLSRRQADGLWALARAWLHRRLADS